MGYSTCMIEVATLWIVSPSGKMLMAQRAHTKANDPSMWGPTMTGRAEPGEAIDDTLVRETAEELGLAVGTYKPTYLHTTEFLDHPDGRPRAFHVYYAVLPEDITDKLTLQREEVEGVEWITVEEIRRRQASKDPTLVFSAPIVWPDTLRHLAERGLVPASA